MKSNNYVAIMAGGIGSRFWPMSRVRNPKQFLDILNTGQSFLQSTFERFVSFIPAENIYIVTSYDYVEIVKSQLPDLDPANIVGEPERKNTAACIAYIAHKLQVQNPEANLIVAPSDHLILDNTAFEKNCKEGLAFTAEHRKFVTFGIKPTSPNTGYGYIQSKDEAHLTLKYVKRFTEKPNKKTAELFLKDKNYFWNSGIFIWKTKDIIASFRQHAPSFYTLFNSIADSYNTPYEKSAIIQVYSNCESISIDYAILEKEDSVYMLPAEFGWSDLGTWNSAWENSTKDNEHNATSGVDTLVYDSKDCIVHSTEKKLIMVGGVEDLIVVNTADVLLICKKENEQQIKDYVALVKTQKGEKYL